MKMFRYIILLLWLSPLAYANQSAQGFCTAGAAKVTVSGITSTTQALTVPLPQCTVTVYNHGTVTPATIYSDNALTPTPLSNPFTASTNGAWQFYAASSHYDVVLSGTGFPAPFTISDVILFDVAGPFTNNITIDGVTYPTFASALPALSSTLGGEVQFPCGTFLIPSEILMSATAGPKFRLHGSGACTILSASGTNNVALHIQGTAGVTDSAFEMDNLVIRDNTSGGSASLVHLDGIAHFNIRSVWVQGNNKASICWLLSASQQGEIAGGSAENCAVLAQTGAIFNASLGAWIHSNGIDWHGTTFVGGTTTTKGLYIPITGGDTVGSADDIFFHSNHMTNAVMGLDITCGFGNCDFFHNHIEPIAAGNKSAIFRGGTNSFIGNGTFADTAVVDVEIAANTRAYVLSNQIAGIIKTDAGIYAATVAHNSVGTCSFQIGDATAQVFDNRVFGGTQCFDATISLLPSSSAPTSDVAFSLPSGKSTFRSKTTNAGDETFIDFPKLTLRDSSNAFSPVFSINPTQFNYSGFINLTPAANIAIKLPSAQSFLRDTTAVATDETFIDFPVVTFRDPSNGFISGFKVQNLGFVWPGGSGDANGLTVRSLTLAGLPASTNGTILYCTDCKNVVDNAAVAGAACVNGGSGAIAKRQNGRWDCN